MKIAILEDQPDILELLTTGLELAGHRAYPYCTGTSLVETLFTSQSKHAPLPYDLLIIDLYLPGMSSDLEVINAIRNPRPAPRTSLSVWILFDTLLWLTATPLGSKSERQPTA